MIAHRLATVTGADKIVVMEKGKVRQQGSHRELLAQNGLYERMWKSYTESITWKLGEFEEMKTSENA